MASLNLPARFKVKPSRSNSTGDFAIIASDRYVHYRPRGHWDRVPYGYPPDTWEQEHLFPHLYGDHPHVNLLGQIVSLECYLPIAALGRICSLGRGCAWGQLLTLDGMACFHLWIFIFNVRSFRALCSSLSMTCNTALPSQYPRSRATSTILSLPRRTRSHILSLSSLSFSRSRFTCPPKPASATRRVQRVSSRPFLPLTRPAIRFRKSSLPITNPARRVFQGASIGSSNESLMKRRNSFTAVRFLPPKNASHCVELHAGGFRRPA